MGLGGHRPTHLGAKPSQSELVFPHKRALLQTEIILSTPSDYTAGEEAGCGGPGLTWLHVVWVERNKLFVHVEHF